MWGEISLKYIGWKFVNYLIFTQQHYEQKPVYSQKLNWITIKSLCSFGAMRKKKKIPKMCVYFLNLSFEE